ncbi:MULTISPECIES: response regulator transcription factor [Bradyrhizobium]|uniref:Response regulator transcription factor n=1 Tax=Bradyrhizobium aeschynomenes TaxID=2734909 RepID=A0ABX2CLK1_9BRAD|nr:MULTISPECIES: response regulator transcription factor [Bradyrhizobium]NPU11613.1 response regulator transcription factor [Bradyrhizobium aeschynomenes]NPU69077.1 response regulator transcription factor [Bradyrhizobium aeschynomenes]NPV23832.1 response regulator transcription factor [Bradyrhizobium aeschynomenes]
MYRVLLVDDHPVVITACRWLLNEAGIGALTAAHDAESAYAAYLRDPPDVAIVDLRLRGDDLGGIGLIERMRSHDPRPRILVFSMLGDPRIVRSAIEAGASGYLLKDAPPQELPKALEQVRAGGTYLDPQLAMRIALLRKEADGTEATSLTPRERQALALLAEAKSYQAIADHLGISYKTVINLTYRLRQKLGARSLPDLVRLAVEMSRPGL